MIIVSLPGSGKSFPNQLALLTLMIEEGIKPDICLATSGGNLTAYTAYISEWGTETMHENIGNLRSELFIKKFIDLTSLWNTPLGTYLYNINKKATTTHVIDLLSPKISKL